MTASDERLRHAALPNGLRIVARRLPGRGAVGVAVNYRAGFRGEPEGRSGMAHLFEHLMFQGSAGFGAGGHFGYVQRLGGTVSGNTFTDISDFHQVVPAGNERRVLEMEADRMQHLILDQERLDVQRRVVLEEINLKVRGAPYGGFPWTVLPRAVYSGWHNAHNGYGDEADLMEITVQECRDFYASAYAPGNAVVAVAGDVDPGRLVDEAVEVFGGLDDRGTPKPPPLDETPGTSPRTHHHRDALAPRPALAIGRPLPAPSDIDRYAAFVVASMWLTGNDHSPLRRALDARGVPCASVCGLFGPWLAAEPDTFTFVAHHDPGGRNAVVDLFDEACERLAATGDDGIGPARRQAHVSLLAQQDSVLGETRALARSELLFGDPGLVRRAMLATATVPATHVHAAARELADHRGRGYAELTTEGQA
ncbi:M16 family metallopeptidase [Streptomyces montanisoli]|uniref:Insulinase family protein n=1 Tax=Streptomyces montanisoli TaxID=2798581 RepID=A0A940RVT2_9ACTN|nr:pitrilysin family protein [Streptomyces montanisoli]MBP0458695.1 insulinase family protein [Streptomyces montanisoli]